MTDFEPTYVAPDDHLIPATRRRLWFNPRVDHQYVSPDYEYELIEPTALTPAPNVASSLCLDGLHRPAIDYDGFSSPSILRAYVSSLWQVPVEDVLIVPSTNNYHAYIPTLPLTFKDYLERLKADPEIEPGYIGASADRFQTILRLPHVKKAAS